MMPCTAGSAAPLRPSPPPTLPHQVALEGGDLLALCLDDVLERTHLRVEVRVPARGGGAAGSGSGFETPLAQACNNRESSEEG